MVPSAVGAASASSWLLAVPVTSLFESASVSSASVSSSGADDASAGVDCASACSGGSGAVGGGGVPREARGDRRFDWEGWEGVVAVFDHPAPGVSLAVSGRGGLQHFSPGMQFVQMRLAFAQVHFVLARWEHLANLEHSQHRGGSTACSMRLRLRGRGLAVASSSS